MQTAGPYRLQRPLSVCDVGDVWSGVDDQGRSVTVAVLNERASADDRWRGAFAAAAEALGAAGADQLPITNSDHDTARPWVACAVERGPGAAQIFVALGRHLEPVAPPAPAVQAPVSGAPTSGAAPVSGAHPPVSGGPTSGAPTSGAAAHPPVSSAPVGGEPPTMPFATIPPAARGGELPNAGATAAARPTEDRTGFRPADGAGPGFRQGEEARPADPRPGHAPAEETRADVTAPAEPRPANGNPWELPPSGTRPADPARPGYDDRTQLVPLVPRQQSPAPDPEPATVPTRLDQPHPEQTYPEQTYPDQAYPEPAYPEQTYTEQAGPHFPAVPALDPHQAAAPQPYPPQDRAATGHPQQGGYPSYPAPTSPAYDHVTGPEHFSPAPAPRSDVGGSTPVSADPFSPFPVSGGPENWQRSRVFGDRPPPKPKRNLLLPALVALVALLVGAGGALAVTAARDGGDDPAPGPTQAAPLTPEQLLLAAAAPTAPGVEPPQGGGWPSSWPVFTSSESTKPITGLAGLGFDFRVPPGWNCTQQDQAAAAVRYRCGAGQGDDASGGELLVRTCEPLCDEAKRTQLRQKEEAWGLRWTRSGPFTTWAETTEIDGKRLYGLVYVAFWRSTPEGQIDRQLVLRMTTPLATSDDLKKVANSIRDSTFTL